MQTGDRTVYKVAQKWEECLGQVGTSWCAEMYIYAGSRWPESASRFSQKTEMHFPFEASTGKCIPF